MDAHAGNPPIGIRRFHLLNSYSRNGPQITSFHNTASVSATFVPGNFFTVGIELLAGNFCPDAGRLERVLNMRQALDHLRIALLHWQFEVDDQFAAKFLGNPFGGQGAAAVGRGALRPPCL